MDSIHDLLQSKVNSLNDSKRNDTALAQQEVDRWHPGQIKVSGIKDGTIYLHTKSAPIASELRMQQMQLLYVLNSALKAELTQIRILIR